MKQQKTLLSNLILSPILTGLCWCITGAGLMTLMFKIITKN